jgi:hypothetical protein
MQDKELQLEDTVSADRKERIIYVGPGKTRKISSITSRQNFNNEKFTRKANKGEDEEDEQEKVEESAIQNTGTSQIENGAPTQSDLINQDKKKKSNSPQIEFVTGTEKASSSSTATGNAQMNGIKKISEALVKEAMKKVKGEVWDDKNPPFDPDTKAEKEFKKPNNPNRSPMDTVRALAQKAMNKQKSVDESILTHGYNREKEAAKRQKEADDSHSHIKHMVAKSREVAIHRANADAESAKSRADDKEAFNKARTAHREAERQQRARHKEAENELEHEKRQSRTNMYKTRTDVEAGNEKRKQDQNLHFHDLLLKHRDANEKAWTKRQNKKADTENSIAKHKAGMKEELEQTKENSMEYTNESFSDIANKLQSVDERIILDKDGNKIGGGSALDSLRNKPVSDPKQFRDRMNAAGNRTAGDPFKKKFKVTKPNTPPGTVAKSTNEEVELAEAEAKSAKQRAEEIYQSKMRNAKTPAERAEAKEDYEHFMKTTNEEVEQIDELSVGALKNYIKGAKASKKFETDVHSTAARKNDWVMASDAHQTLNKRKEGIKAAKAKLNKEGTEMKSYQEFLDQLLEYTPGPGGVTRVQGRSYGAQYHDPEGDDDADDKAPAAKPADAPKRGRGRPAGSKSGANQKVTTGKSYGGIATHSLHLPNSK